MPEVTATIPNLDGKDTEIILSLPVSLARRWAVSDLYFLSLPDAPTVAGLASVAALGLCWGEPRKRAPKAVWQGNPATYGETVLDDLLSRGVTIQAIRRAGTVAMALIVESLHGTADTEAKKAEDFSDPPKGGSTS